MKNISIPEPCSENWNEMSATEKGAFCQKCAIDVYDFTNKSGDEIRDILKLNIGGRVCGRIEPKQLDELNDDFMAWEITNKQSFNRAWIFSLLVVFGMTLFSCEEDEIPVVQGIQKTAQAFLSEVPDSVEVSESEFIDVEDSSADGTQTMRGKIVIAEDVDFIPEEKINEELLGEMMIIEDHEEREVQEMMNHNLPMAGGISYSSAYAESLKDTSEPVCEVKMSGFVYPNPAQNQTTLKVTMPNTGEAQIELFSLAGQKIRTIHSGEIRKGESEYPINLVDLDSGYYLVVIYCDGKKETVKFSKL